LCFLFLRLSIVHSALFRCDLLFGIQSFLFSSLVPLLGVFPLFIYLSDCSWSFTSASAAAKSTSSLKPTTREHTWRQDSTITQTRKVPKESSKSKNLQTKMFLLSLAPLSTLAVKICVKFSSIIECTILSIFFLLLFVGHFEKWKGEGSKFKFHSFCLKPHFNLLWF